MHGEQQQAEVFFLIAVLPGEVDADRNYGHGLPFFKLGVVAELFQLFKQLALLDMALEGFDQAKGPHLPEMLGDLFFQLGFGLEQMMHLLADDLELVGMPFADIRSALAHLVEQPFNGRVHFAGAKPGEQYRQQQHQGAHIDGIGSDFVRLLGQARNRSH
ncbi:hypothetical protein D3C73_917730 [compost metagenome]